MMQVFLLDKDPATNASYYMDKHVVKIPNDLLLILVNSLARKRVKFPQIRTGSGMPMMPNPKVMSNPLCKWASSRGDNFDWLLALGHHLCMEHAKRHKEIHYLFDSFLEFDPFCTPAFWATFWLGANPAEGRLQVLERMVDFGRFPWVLPMAYQNKEVGLVASYRQYYIETKNYLARWTKRAPPDWFPQSAIDEGKKIASAFHKAKKDKHSDVNLINLTTKKED